MIQKVNRLTVQNTACITSVPYVSLYASSEAKNEVVGSLNRTREVVGYLNWTRRVRLREPTTSGFV